MMKYEYKVIEMQEKGLFLATFKLEDLEDELNFQGDKGWELASTFAKNTGINRKEEVVLIFKRAVSEN